MLTKFLYNLIYYYPNITTRKINQLAWIYQRTYSDLGLTFGWARGFPWSAEIWNTFTDMLRSECISAKRPKGGKPKIAYCWTVGQNKICKGYKENWEIDVLETFKYYLEDDNRRELRVKTNLLRIRRPSFQSLHRETKNNRRLRRILRRRLGRRGSPYVNTVERTLEGTS